MSGDIQAVLDTISRFSYIGVFGFSLLANLFVPVPEEIFLLVLGYLTAAGVFNPILVTVIVIIGFSIIDSSLYFLARRGNKFLLRMRDKFLKRLSFNDGKIMARHANKVIFFARFLVQFRFLGPVLAGSYKVPFKRFFLVNLSALVVYVPLVILLGDYFHSRLERVIDGIGVARNIVFVIIGIFVAIAIFKFMRSLFIKYLKSMSDKMMEFLGIEVTEKEEIKLTAFLFRSSMGEILKLYKMHTNIDTTNKHKKNGRIQKQISLRNGYEITVSFFPGIAGESGSINIHNGNANATDEGNQKEYCIPLMEAKELKELSKNINEILKEREKTLIKKKKKK